MVNKNGVVKIMDFGIARPAEASIHTQESATIGTIHYLSPEQLEDKEVFHLTDIYSFGAVLYEMLTGQKAFSQKTVTSIIKNKTSGNYKKIESYRLNISSKLTKLVNRCLNRDMNKRPQHYKDILDSLERIYNSKTKEYRRDIIKAYSDNDLKTQRIKQTALKKKITISTLLLIILSCLIFVIAYIKFFSREDDKKISNNNITKIREQEQGNKPRKTEKDFIEFEPLSEKNNENEVKETDLKQNREKNEETKEDITRKSPEKPVKKKENRVVKRPLRKNLSEIEILENKYFTDKTEDIILKAWESKNHKDVLKAFRIEKNKDEFKSNTYVYIIDSYRITNQQTKALKLIKKSKVSDPLADIIKGIAKYRNKYYTEALEDFQKSITRPSITHKNDYIRKEAIYYTALIYEKIYSDNENAINNAWKNVKRLYINDKNNKRYIEAKEKIKRR